MNYRYCILLYRIINGQSFIFIFGFNTPWLATVVIPDPDYEIRGQAPAGIQKSTVLPGFWIPD